MLKQTQNQPNMPKEAHVRLNMEKHEHKIQIHPAKQPRQTSKFNTFRKRKVVGLLTPFMVRLFRLPEHCFHIHSFTHTLTHSLCG